MTIHFRPLEVGETFVEDVTIDAEVTRESAKMVAHFATRARYEVTATDAGALRGMRVLLVDTRIRMDLQGRTFHVAPPSILGHVFAITRTSEGGQSVTDEEGHVASQGDVADLGVRSTLLVAPDLLGHALDRKTFARGVATRLDDAFPHDIARFGSEWRNDGTLAFAGPDRGSLEFRLADTASFTLNDVVYVLRGTGVIALDGVMGRMLAYRIEGPLSRTDGSAAGRLRVAITRKWGDTSLTATRLAPEPRARNAAPPADVSADDLAGQRIAGDPDPTAPSDVLDAAKRKGLDPLRIRVRACFDEEGTNQSAEVVASSGYAELDAAVVAQLRTWAYDPYLVEGTAVPFCFPIDFTWPLE